MNDGSVMIWGDIGDCWIRDSSTVITEHMLVPGLHNVKQIAAGGIYAIALMNDGTLKAWETIVMDS